jgi:hypothetical protein
LTLHEQYTEKRWGEAENCHLSLSGSCFNIEKIAWRE